MTLKFSIVREDPAPELELLDLVAPRPVLCVASGGCTLFELKLARPDVRVDGFDFNPSQLEHVRAKRVAISQGDLGALNVGHSNPEGLNQSGAFEGLFRLLRGVLVDLVSSRGEVTRFFNPDLDPRERELMLASWFASPYWPMAFETAFYHPLLDTMFTSAATQHAEPGSYPRYFQAVFERGLSAPDAHTNPFLQHVLLSHYRADCSPAHTRANRDLDVGLIPGSLLDVPDLGDYGLVSLSNVFDWSDDTLTSAWATVLCDSSSPGTWIVIRQLNNERDLRSFFEPMFVFDDERSARLSASDRSMFYNRIEVAMRKDDER